MYAVLHYIIHAIHMLYYTILYLLYVCLNYYAGICACLVSKSERMTEWPSKGKGIKMRFGCASSMLVGFPSLFNSDKECHGQK